MKNAHLLRCPHSLSLRRTFSTPHSSEFRLPARSRFGEGRGALHLAIFDQLPQNDYFNRGRRFRKRDYDYKQWVTLASLGKG